MGSLLQPLFHLTRPVRKGVGLRTVDLANGKNVVVKNVVHLFECLAARLLEEKEDVAEGGKGERAKDHIDAPLDILEGRRGEEGEREITRPVEDGGERDSLGADVQRDDFRRVDPAHGTPSGCVRGDKEVAASNNGLARSSDMQCPCYGGRTVEAAGDGVAVGGHDGAHGEEEDRHSQTARHHDPASGELVDEKEGGDRHDHVDNVLDTGDGEVVGAAETGHFEDVDNVVHEGIGAAKLRPDMGEDGDM